MVKMTKFAETKQCTKCNLTKSLCEFYNRKGVKDGKKSHCKKCMNEYHSYKIKTDKDFRERQNQSVKNWRKNNPNHNKEYREVNKERIKFRTRDYYLKKRYGISSDDYDILLKEQSFKCKICNSPPNKNNTKDEVLAVDHCHKTSKVRGLLCDLCNRALGNFKDNISILENAIKYLEESKNAKIQ